jgi:hypothetical protein
MLIRYVNKYCVVIGKFMPFKIKTNYVLFFRNKQYVQGWLEGYCEGAGLLCLILCGGLASLKRLTCHKIKLPCKSVKDFS